MPPKPKEFDIAALASFLNFLASFPTKALPSNAGSGCKRFNVGGA